jgi:hypothetical protein
VIGRVRHRAQMRGTNKNLLLVSDENSDENLKLSKASLVGGVVWLQNLDELISKNK